MQFSVQQKEILNKTQQALRFISTKPQLPILSCFHLQVTKDELILSATDLQEGIHLSLPVTVVEEGICVVPAKVFVEFLSTLEDQIVKCEVKASTFYLKSKRNSIKLQTMSVSDFPEFPEKEGKKIEIPLTLLKESAEKVAFASSRDETRPILTSILVSLGKSATIVSTDGFRLALLEKDFSSEESKKLLFPARALQETTKILAEEGVKHVDVYLSEKLKQGFFIAGKTEVMIRLLEGDFPKYQQIYPQNFAIEVRVDKEQLENVIKSALIFAKESAGIISFELKEKELHVRSASSSLGEFHSTLEILSAHQGTGKVSFNGKYLVEFLQKIESKDVWFKMNDDVKPGLFVPDDQPGYQYLVMPFKLN